MQSVLSEGIVFRTSKESPQMILLINFSIGFICEMFIWICFESFLRVKIFLTKKFIFGNSDDCWFALIINDDVIVLFEPEQIILNCSKT